MCKGFHSHNINTQTIFKFPGRLIGRRAPTVVPGTTYVGYTAEELLFTRNPAIDVVVDRLAAPRRNFEADSAAPWQRAPPLDHVQLAAVRA